MKTKSKTEGVELTFSRKKSKKKAKKKQKNRDRGVLTDALLVQNRALYG